ncbi:P-loop containing nucleoside triphosphate hydrolase protein [Aspergillus tamarii]|uniref:P-loop containing nucleoside triphosphate hydrolase protein n=1 Tax=Aspergillus tamarii TaxID=41984 RepID=A0A5N6VAD6_ASPTM|nr:P-loop containing nucleoside triphosphate hydrolase protein [Aspergillus tamarii]
MYALQRLLYGFPKPPSHKRTKPVEVLCLGLPRTGTESLSVALRTLGLQTYHGWDLVFEPDGRKLQLCAELVRRKYNGARDGDVHITSAEFDILVGDSQAVVDSLCILFAPELLAAYPDAKVVLNVRPDTSAWYRSINKTIVEEVDQSWVIWVMQWFSAEFHWLYSLYLRDGYPGIFHSSTTKEGIQRNAKWVYRDHCNMVRGMVPKDNLLEWSVEDGWQPLCKFLDKPVPNEPFPRTNNPGDYAEHANKLIKQRSVQCLRNLTLTAVTLGGITTAVVMWWQGRIPKVTRLGDLLGRFTRMT